MIFVQAMVGAIKFPSSRRSPYQQAFDRKLIELSASVFVIGLQIGAPLIVALFLANAVIGLLARSVPQIQVFL
ncbi:MAG: hypothetical protein Ct9H300mP28_25430 [Pseudomonadota bacterium]|nr:MAG: hypothetical protein Ct9H300mP28_25430 [Pseudomonadota bacterium]